MLTNRSVVEHKCLFCCVDIYYRYLISNFYEWSNMYKVTMFELKRNLTQNL